MDAGKNHNEAAAELAETERFKTEAENEVTRLRNSITAPPRAG